MLFAQRMLAPAQMGGGGGNGNQNDDALAIVIIVMVAFMAIGIAIQVMYLLTLSRALKNCDPRNRAMDPSHVWLNLIPLFGMVWIFITVNRIADSLADEYDDRRLRVDGDFGRNQGVMYNVMFLLGIIPYIGGIFSIVGLIMWILYWIKIAGYSRRLAETSQGNYDDEDDAYDDRRDPREDDDRRHHRDGEDEYDRR